MTLPVIPDPLLIGILSFMVLYFYIKYRIAERTKNKLFGILKDLADTQNLMLTYWEASQPDPYTPPSPDETLEVKPIGDEEWDVH